MQAEDYTYVTNNGTITITRYFGTGGVVTVPSTINGLPVTRIESAAFSGCSSVTTITIPNSVTNIGGAAFAGCSSLTAIEVNPANPTYSSRGSVLFNKSQTTLIEYPRAMPGHYSIPNSVTSIGHSAFCGCHNLTSVTIPNSVTRIEGGAFERCTRLTSVTIPNSVIWIGYTAFMECDHLTSVTIGSNVANIGYLALHNCPSLAAITVDASNLSYSSVDGVLFNKSLTTLLIYPEGKIGNYTVPTTVTSIEEFFSCTHLTSITIPSSVTNMHAGALADCPSLTEIAVDASNPSYSSVAGVLFNKSQTTLIGYPGGKAGAYSIPNSVTNIGISAFYGCKSLTSVTIPDSVTVIDPMAFYHCTSLTSITIPDSVTSIGYGLFQNCSNLSNAQIGNNVASIPELAFAGCTSLTSITIPDSVTRIETYAFTLCISLSNVTIGNKVTSIAGGACYECTSLTAVYFRGNAPWIDWLGSDNNAIVYYLPGTIGWGSTFGDRPTALWQLPYPVILTTTPNFGVQTNGFGFRISWATNLPVVVEASTTLATPAWSPLSTNTLTDGWTYFSDAEWTNYPSRFYRVRPLSVDEQYTYITNNGVITITKYIGPGGDLIIPDKINGLPVTVIGLEAFVDCSSLTNVIIPGSVTTIQERAMQHCTSLMTVGIGDGVTIIDEYAFSGCTSLTRVTMPNSLAVIDQGAFSECTSLTSINIPTSVTRIGNGTFAGCSSLTSITVDALNPAYNSLDGVLFNKSRTTLIRCPCSRSGGYAVPDGVTTVGYEAFAGCRSLTNVSVLSGVTNVDGFAFWDCSSLKSVTIPDSVTTIGYAAFRGCTSLTGIIVSSLNPSYTSVDGVLFDKSRTILIRCPCAMSGTYRIPNGVTTLGEEAFSECGSLTNITVPSSLTYIWFCAFEYLCNSDSHPLRGERSCLRSQCVRAQSIRWWCLPDRIPPSRRHWLGPNLR